MIIVQPLVIILTTILQLQPINWFRVVFEETISILFRHKDTLQVEQRT